jgi:predicted Rossmann-fold nucleotide-binding protein
METAGIIFFITVLASKQQGHFISPFTIFFINHHWMSYIAASRFFQILINVIVLGDKKLMQLANTAKNKVATVTFYKRTRGC